MYRRKRISRFHRRRTNVRRPHRRTRRNSRVRLRSGVVGFRL